MPLATVKLTPKARKAKDYTQSDPGVERVADLGSLTPDDLYPDAPQRGLGDRRAQKEREALRKQMQKARSPVEFQRLAHLEHASREASRAAADHKAIVGDCIICQQSCRALCNGCGQPCHRSVQCAVDTKSKDLWQCRQCYRRSAGIATNQEPWTKV